MQYSKLKTLLIYNILEKYSDEEHPLSTTDLISMLEEKGVKCERKSIYADIAALNDIGCDIITVTSPKRGFFMASRTFEIPEVMLLIDAVSSAGFITPKKTASLIEKLETLVSVEQAKTMKSQVYVDTSCAKCDNEEIYIIIDRLNNAIADEKRLNLFIAGVVLTCKTVKNILKKRLPSLLMLLFGKTTIITLSAIIKNTIIL